MAELYISKKSPKFRKFIRLSLRDREQNRHSHIEREREREFEKHPFFKNSEKGVKTGNPYTYSDQSGILFYTKKEH